MDFRNIAVSDISLAKKLWLNCFGDEQGYIDLFFEDLFDEHTGIALYDDNSIVSMAMLLPQVLKLGNYRYPIFYLYAMCTDKEKQGMGFGLKLLSYIEDFSKANDIYGIALLPGDLKLVSFYKKAGYKEFFSENSPDENYIEYSKEYIQHIHRIADYEGEVFKEVTKENTVLSPCGMFLDLKGITKDLDRAFMAYPMN